VNNFFFGLAVAISCCTWRAVYYYIAILSLGCDSNFSSMIYTLWRSTL